MKYIQVGTRSPPVKIQKKKNRSPTQGSAGERFDLFPQWRAAPRHRMVVWRGEDWSSPAEYEEVHGDGGAPTADGGDWGGFARGRCIRPATPAFTDAGDHRVCSAPSTSSGRQGRLRRRPPLPRCLSHHPLAAATAGWSWWGTRGATRTIRPRSRETSSTPTLASEGSKLIGGGGGTEGSEVLVLGGDFGGEA